MLIVWSSVTDSLNVLYYPTCLSLSFDSIHTRLVRKRLIGQCQLDENNVAGTVLL